MTAPVELLLELLEEELELLLELDEEDELLLDEELELEELELLLEVVSPTQAGAIKLPS